ncbi:hypothetical protein ACFX59_02350 [Sphingomonas sp. NCPPB 2930]|uniref:hypothetical protein n=1 Tax=Sphingomonas sp. NCPPB 2930 TaxID=3162788 RepID=UPI0036DC6715
MRDLREILIWFLLSDVLMLASAATEVVAPKMPAPLDSALILQTNVFAALCLGSLAIALGGMALTAIRWKRSR